MNNSTPSMTSDNTPVSEAISFAPKRLRSPHGRVLSAILSLTARTIKPDWLPSRGIVLVTGRCGSGKDTAILQPLISQYVRAGRTVRICDRKSGLRKPDQTPSGGSLGQVFIINEAQTFPGEVSAAIASVAENSNDLYIISLQSIVALPLELRTRLLGDPQKGQEGITSCEIFLAYADTATAEYAQHHSHEPTSFAQPFTYDQALRPHVEAAIYRREFVDNKSPRAWTFKGRRLRLVFAAHH